MDPVAHTFAGSLRAQHDRPAEALLPLLRESSAVAFEYGSSRLTCFQAGVEIESPWLLGSRS